MRLSILDYCHGRLAADQTSWAQRHIARCPACFPMVMKTLDALEKGDVVRDASCVDGIIDVEWVPITPKKLGKPTGPLHWLLAFSLVLFSLGGLFIMAFHRVH
ncbi:MAG: hypothetical protein HY232_20125 [Acidobacteria bacterium]|nr:hypothetical protein [Acidobacteriota bacterium]